MDGIRHLLALLLWVAFPPALGFWLLLHPFVRFWRRLGPAATYPLALLGWALRSNYLVSYLIFGLWLPVLWATVLLEERELRDRFGAEWDAYARRVPRFLPRRP